MDFQTCLENICNNVPGAFAATLMGMDGLPVESVEREIAEDEEGLELSSLLVEYAAMLAQIKQSAEVFSAGPLEELSIRSGKVQAIFRPVTEEYFLILAMSPKGSTGIGRYALRVHAPQLVDELS